MKSTSYRRLQQLALLISVISVLYCGAEGAVSIVLGAESASRSLVFFGIQSGIEVASATVVLWRFRKVAKPGEERGVVVSPENLRVEKVGTWSIGILIAMLAVATEITAIVGLAQHSEPDLSNASLIVSASALVIMVLIWAPKVTLAKRLDSSTMAGEATCSLSCIQITIVLFVGSLVFRLWKGGWWVDSATSLVLGMMFGREAYKMLSWVRDPEFNGGCCGGCSSSSSSNNATEKIRIERDAELGEQYRDLCECCYEKEECREAETCKCDTPSSEEEESPSETAVGESEVERERRGCCVPVMPNGQACCTRELLQGPRARPQREVVEAQKGCADKCCSKVEAEAEVVTSDDSESCCGGKAVNAPGPAVSSSCQKGCCQS